MRKDDGISPPLRSEGGGGPGSLPSSLHVYAVSLLLPLPSRWVSDHLPSLHPDIPSRAFLPQGRLTRHVLCLRASAAPLQIVLSSFPCSSSDECQIFPPRLRCTGLLNFYHLLCCAREVCKDETRLMNGLSGLDVCWKGLLPRLPARAVGRQCRACQSWVCAPRSSPPVTNHRGSAT